MDICFCARWMLAWAPDGMQLGRPMGISFGA